MSKKGFIQIPLLVWVIVSLIIGTGVVLYKQGKLKPTANISESIIKEQSIFTPTIKPNLEFSPIDEPDSTSDKTPASTSSLTPSPTPTLSSTSTPTPAPTSIPILTPAPTPTPTSSPTPTSEKQELLFKVVKVVDGDTIKLENGEVVRYIGIDTPETVHPSKPVQCFGKEASDKNKESVEGKLIKLEKDITDRDKYGRLLRYVWVGDLFVNDYLVRQGYAYAYTYPPDVEYSEQFVQAQREAKENNRGLWAGCPEQGVVEETPSPPAEPTPIKEGIICSYNAYNCSDFSTHVEAQSVFKYCGGVTNDVHRLDTDKDGLACESLP